jgi:uncharacterized hydantoinase/oxoprolinase family protein
MPHDFSPEENKICDKSIGFLLSNGKIHDTNGVREKYSTNWRATGKVIAKSTPCQIKIVVDIDKQHIEWFSDG